MKLKWYIKFLDSLKQLLSSEDITLYTSAVSLDLTPQAPKRIAPALPQHPYPLPLGRERSKELIQGNKAPAKSPAPHK